METETLPFLLPRALAGMELGNIVRYNEQHTGLSPLDRPGSEEYFVAVMSLFRRLGEAHGKKALPEASRPAKVKAVKLPPCEVFSGQLCAKCDRKLMPGESCFVVPDWPAVVCAPCQPLCRSGGYSGVHVPVISLQEAVAPPPRKRKNWSWKPTLVRAVAV